MLRKTKSARTLWLVLLVGTFLFGLLGSGSLAATQEPQWKSLDTTTFDSGPGWPQGWVPPETPTAISPERQAEYEEIIGRLSASQRPEHLELRVQPLPDWTREFPYYWKHGFTRCQTTAYLYYYAMPDMELVGQMATEDFEESVGAAGGTCGSFTQVLGIQKPLPMSEEAKEKWRLYEKMVDSRAQAQKGLGDCSKGSANTLESILVCFNEGEASKLFDVPAYLDTTVSRVRVPVRFVSELMGAAVTWDEITRQVTINFPAKSLDMVKLVSAPGHTTSDWWQPDTGLMIDENTVMKETTITQSARRIVLSIDSTTAYVDGSPVSIDAPPVIRGDRTMVPIRFVSEQLGAKVYWVGRDPIFPAYGRLLGTYQVHIYTPFHPFYDSPDWFLENRAVKS